VILGPTEHRVARWLADRTRNGRITLRMVDVATANRLERSEAYRVTARLRILGLFGIENDRAGTHGGRRFWRTAIAHDGAALDETRHREAWARVVAWARAKAFRLAARLGPQHLRSPGSWAVGRPTAPAREIPPSPAGAGILGRLIAGGLSPGLAAEFAEARRARR
jgi:hypothetical protein